MQTTLDIQTRFTPTGARGFLIDASETAIGRRALETVADDDASVVVAAYAVRAQLRQAYGDIF